jgi:hypothetical protein
VKFLFENWRQYEKGPEPFYVSIEKVVSTEELGGSEKYNCFPTPDKECESAIDAKISQIMGGEFEPIVVCLNKPLNVSRLVNDDEYQMPPKNSIAEPFYYVLDVHHRLEAAKRLGLRQVPVIRDEGAHQ